MSCSCPCKSRSLADTQAIEVFDEIVDSETSSYSRAEWEYVLSDCDSISVDVQTKELVTEEPGGAEVTVSLQHIDPRTLTVLSTTTLVGDLRAGENTSGYTTNNVSKHFPCRLMVAISSGVTHVRINATLRQKDDQIHWEDMVASVPNACTTTINLTGVSS